jgi:hypothetical protein
VRDLGGGGHAGHGESQLSQQSDKDLARSFLERLEDKLSEHLPGPGAMDSWIRRKVAAAKSDKTATHLRNPEAAFLNGQVILHVFETLQEGRWALSSEQARAALLNEYYRSMRDCCSGSPSRSLLHPFEKAMNAGAGQVYKRWAAAEKGPSLKQACPDFALRDPFPAPIVFEGKYFARGTLDKAQRELANSIYQAAFYRSLPPVPATARTASWDYNFACMLAFDASPGGALKEAWQSLDNKVRKSFWEGANVYVMVLRGNARKTES